MLHSHLFAPFEDPARQAQYHAVQAALEAEGPAVPSVLLGNFEVGDEVLDALVVRPRSLTVLLFVPQGGLLTITDEQPAAWQLDAFRLEGDADAANPFEQFLRQQEAVAAWLSQEWTPTAILPEQITGLMLFAGAVQFGAGVETYLRRQPGAESFQLLSDLGQLPRRLRWIKSPDLHLPDEQLLTWFTDLTTAPAHQELVQGEEAPREEGGFWEQKARQLWRWLGADDIPHDAPYGSAAEAVAASQQEKQRLEQLSQQVRAELAQQRQEMEAREAERERSIEQLRAQLTQAPSAAAEVAALQARLAAETREKSALEEAIRASQAESATRNQELDARIQQLGQLIEQLQARPAAALPPPAAATVKSKPNPARPAPARVAPAAPAAPARRVPSGNLFARPSWRLQWPRAAVVLVLAVSLLGVVGWGLGRLATTFSSRYRPSEARSSPRQISADEEEASGAAPSLADIQPDTLLVEDEQAPEPTAQPISTDSSEQQAPELVDSVQNSPEESPTPPDSSASDSETPTP